ncbi:MAG: hypothetical protein RLZZ630_644, partial [Bacteroidota bacterium]
MAALQGAKVPGADTRCANNGTGTSSLFAFLEVAQPTDSIGQPSLLVSVKTPGGAGIEPIDSLQILFDAQHSCTTAGLSSMGESEWKIYPNPAEDHLLIDFPKGNSQSTNATYRLVDSRGRQCLSGYLTITSTRIDLRGLSAGVYVLEIDYGIERFQRKVIRK